MVRCPHPPFHQQCSSLVGPEVWLCSAASMGMTTNIEASSSVEVGTFDSVGSDFCPGCVVKFSTYISIEILYMYIYTHTYMMVCQCYACIHMYICIHTYIYMYKKLVPIDTPAFLERRCLCQVSRAACAELHALLFVC